MNGLAQAQKLYDGREPAEVADTREEDIAECRENLIHNIQMDDKVALEFYNDAIGYNTSEEAIAIAQAVFGDAPYALMSAMKAMFAKHATTTAEETIEARDFLIGLRPQVRL